MERAEGHRQVRVARAPETMRLNGRKPSDLHLENRKEWIGKLSGWRTRE